MIIGSLGKVFFKVSKKEILTFSEVSWQTKARYATHERHLKMPLQEFLGTGTDTISFSMTLSSYFGINPMKELIRLLDMLRKGTASRLVLGQKAYGRGKWVIENIENQLKYFDKKGNVTHININITLKEDALI